MKGKTFIIAGPSGVGKGTITKELFARQKNLYFSVSATTRAPRPGEVDGVHYHFLSREEFSAVGPAGRLFRACGICGKLLRTPKRFVDEAMARGEDVILDIEIQGAEQVHRKRPEAIRIFIAPPSWEELEHRADRPRNRVPGEGPQPPGPGQGGVFRRRGLRLYCHQQLAGAGGGGAAGHSPG